MKTSVLLKALYRSVQSLSKSWFFFSLEIVKLILHFIRNLKGFWAASTILEKELNWMTFIFQFENLLQKQQ